MSTLVVYAIAQRITRREAHYLFKNNSAELKQVGGAGEVRPPRARAKAKAAPKQLAGKFAAPNLQRTVAAKTKARGKKK